MRYEARITAYDMLDHVMVALVVHETEGDEPPTRQPVLTRSAIVPGTGESDPSRWTTDAVVALLETL